MLTVRSRDLSIAARISLKDARAYVLTLGPVTFAASGYVVAFRKFGWPVGVARVFAGTATVS